MGSEDKTPDETSEDVETCEYEDFSINVHQNEVHFTGDITSESVHQLSMKMRALDKRLSLFNGEQIIHLFITSDGGCLFSGFKCYDIISSLRCTIHTYAVGLVASAGTLPFMAGSKRFMGDYSFVLIHQLSKGVSAGEKFEEAKANLKNDKMLMKKMRKLVESKGNVPEDKLTEMLKNDIYLDSEKCHKWAIAQPWFK